MTEPEDALGSRAWVAAIMERVFEECRALRGAGQREYARRDENAFANFERVAERLKVSREKVLLVYLEKHLDGIHSWADGHVSQREPVEGRMNDAIVYLCLLRGMLEQRRSSERVALPKIESFDESLKQRAEAADVMSRGQARAKQP